MSRRKLTALQRETMRAVRAADGWYRAAGHGQRVVLASLFRMGRLERRAHRLGKSSADNAYEYRVPAALLSAIAGP